MATMIAKRPFQYRSRRLSAGQIVEINRRDERYLRAIGWIDDAPVVEPVVEQVVDDDESPKKRAYKRRDMTAEE